MSSIDKILGRTVKTNIILYSTDNRGRDGYITYNNGGFWKDNLKEIKLKSNYPKNIKYNFHSLIHQAAPFNYYSDGRGRDTYVLQNNAGLVKEFNPLAKRQILSKYLRKNIPFSYDIKKKDKHFFITPFEKNNFLKNHKTQKNVVKRLYDECLEKFKEKIKSNSSFTKNYSINSIDFSNNFPNKNTEFSKTIYKTKTNDKMNKKILKIKMNNTHNNFFNPLKCNKNPFIENLKNNNNIIDNNYNYNPFFNSNNYKNIKNKLNCLSPRNLNTSTQNNNNNTNKYLNKTLLTSYNEFNKRKKNEIIDLNNSNINKNDKNKTLKIEIKNERPLSYRRLFQKKQIFNNSKPFLVDDFQEYSNYY